MFFSTKTFAVLLISFSILGGLASLSINNRIDAQPFDITTEQTTDVATITVQLAQPNETVIIPPNGSIIEVPATNITVIDNDTVVIVPENETVTELPGNVTVITPPEPEPCGCPTGENETGAAEPAAGEPVVVRPAAGQDVLIYEGPAPVDNITVVPFPSQQPPAAAPPAAGNETIELPPGSNVTVPTTEDNQTALSEEDQIAIDSGDDNNATNSTGGLTPSSAPATLQWLKDELQI